MSKEKLESKIERPDDIIDREKEIADRRALLKKIGRFGLYTAPTLMIAYTSAQAAIIPSGSS